MPGFELAERAAAKVISTVESSPALVAELEALLGRTPLKRVAASSISLLESSASSELVAGGDRLGRIMSKGIPSLTDGYLPPGIHTAQWSDLVERYGADPNRSKFFPGMFHALHDLKEGGVNRAYLGGSFVTSSIRPNDFDIAFEGVFRKGTPRAYTEILKDRDLMKRTYGGELLHDHLEFFRQARGGVTDVGVLKLDLDSLAPRVEKSPAFSIYDEWVKLNSKRTNFLERLQTTPAAPRHEDFYSFSTFSAPH